MKHETELNYEPIIIIVLAKWFLSDFFIAGRPIHTRTMGLKGTNILIPIVIFFICKATILCLKVNVLID